MKRRAEYGMMTVEAVLSLVPFIMVILGIISFTDIYRVHNKIQYAMHQVGSELSAYTYFYEALGLRSADLGLKDDIDSQTEPVDTAIENISDFIGDLNSLSTSAIQSGQAAGSSLSGFVDDPKSLLRGIVFLGIEGAENTGKQLLISWMSQGMMEKYLDESYLPSNARDADTFLKKCGVRDGLAGLDYSNSQLFQDSEYRMIDLVVEYDVEVYILKLFLKDPTIHVTQRATIPAWLDGDGVEYTKE